MSDEFLWSTDSVAFMWRLRLDGRFSLAGFRDGRARKPGGAEPHA